MALSKLTSIAKSVAKKLLSIVVSSKDSIADLRAYEPLIDGQQISLLGHTVKGVGGGKFFHDASDTTSSDNNGTVIVTSKGERWKREFTDVNVQYFGALGDGTTDDTEAFKSARDLIKTISRTVPESPNPLGGPKIYLPYGTYKITEAGALMDSGFSTRIAGLEYFGDPGTAILYDSGAVASNDFGANALMYLNDSFLFITVRDIHFNFQNPLDDFWYSASSGGTQDVLFDRCNWNGSFRKGFDIAGGNDTNSEFKWINSTVNGGVEQFLDVRATDQNLNYWFSNFKFWADYGTWIRATVGGHFKLDKSCDVSGHLPTVDTYLFELLGDNHAQGVCSFIADGTRYEHKTDQSKLIKCEWPFGVVSLQNIDQSSNSGFTSSAIISALFNLQNVGGPSIDFTGARLAGRHEYTYKGNQWGELNNIRYVGVQHSQINDPDDFLLITKADGNFNDGGIPNITFEGNCRGRQAYSAAGNKRYVWDRSFGAVTRAVATVTENIVVLKTPSGGLPANGGSSLVAVLPKGVYITKIDLFSSNGSVTDAGAFDFSVVDADAKVLANVAGTPYSAGFRDITETQFFVDTINERTIHLVDNGPVTQSSKKSWVRVHYVG